MTKLWLRIPAKGRDVIVRALKTFIQAFVATILVTWENGDVGATVSIIIGAASAALSVAWNSTFKPPEPSV